MLSVHDIVVDPAEAGAVEPDAMLKPPPVLNGPHRKVWLPPCVSEAKEALPTTSTISSPLKLVTPTLAVVPDAAVFPNDESKVVVVFDPVTDIEAACAAPPGPPKLTVIVCGPEGGLASPQI